MYTYIPPARPTKRAAAILVGGIAVVIVACGLAHVVARLA